MIKTTINVICNEKGKAIPYNGVVVGEIVKVELFPDLLGVHFQYKKEDGSILYSSNDNEPKYLTKDEVNVFYDLISTSLPASVNWYTDRFTELYEAMKIEMADTFGITVEQIENI